LNRLCITSPLLQLWGKAEQTKLLKLLIALEEFDMAAEGFAVTKVGKMLFVFYVHVVCASAAGTFCRLLSSGGSALRTVTCISSYALQPSPQLCILAQVASMRRSLRSVESTGDTVTFAAELSVSFFAALQDGCHSFKTLFEVER
jgi:hypothetical protein